MEEVISKVIQSHHYSDPLVTKVVPFIVLYPAENYHQGYYKLHGSNPYIQHVSVPKVDIPGSLTKLFHALWSTELCTQLGR